MATSPVRQPKLIIKILFVNISSFVIYCLQFPNNAFTFSLTEQTTMKIPFCPFPATNTACRKAIFNQINVNLFVNTV